MRRWHRLLAPWFALLLLLLAATGLATQATDLLDTPPPKAAAAPTAESTMKRWNHWLKHIHSGESLGPAGIALNVGGGVALLFFAGSGFWMYLSMAINRRRNRSRRRTG